MNPRTLHIANAIGPLRAINAPCTPPHPKPSVPRSIPNPHAATIPRTIPRQTDGQPRRKRHAGEPAPRIRPDSSGSSA